MFIHGMCVCVCVYVTKQFTTRYTTPPSITVIGQCTDLLLDNRSYYSLLLTVLL